MVRELRALAAQHELVVLWLDRFTVVGERVGRNSSPLRSSGGEVRVVARRVMQRAAVV